jgi:hypothetical protein
MAAAAACLMPMASADAALIFFQPASGDWEVPGNWNTVEGGGGTAGLPGDADGTVIRGGDSAQFTAASGDQTVNTIQVGGGSNGALTIGGDDTLRADSVSGFGLIVATGASSTGTVNLNGATFVIDADAVVGYNPTTNNSTQNVTGTVNHSGGTFDIGGDLRLGYSVGGNNKTFTGNYNVSGTAIADIEGRIYNGFAGGGSGSTTPGNIEITGSAASIDVGAYSQHASSSLTFIADASGVSSIDVATTLATSGTGVVILNGALELDLSGLASNFLNDILLIDNDLADAITGTFSSVIGLNGTSVVGDQVSFGSNSFTLTYTGGTGNDLVLVNNAAFEIPEPAALGMLGLAGAALLRRRGR